MNQLVSFGGAAASAPIDPKLACAAGEEARLGFLARYDPDSVADDPELHAIAAFAAKLCNTPIGLVSLVERERQRFLGRIGLKVSETPRPQSFCQHAMMKDRIMVVPDAANDPRFAANVLVTGAPHIRFYAGAPLVSEEGAPLGSLCVISPEPREGLTPLQKDGLRVLAGAVMRRLSARRHELEKLSGEEIAEQAMIESDRRFQMLADAMPQMAWSTDALGIPDYFNQRWFDFTGTTAGQHFNEDWVDLLHPDDQARASDVWSKAVTSGTPYEVEYRLRRADGEYRWTLARGLPVKGLDGRIVRWFGTNTDIHETRLLIESQQLLSRELNHRIKNIFSVVSGLVSFASRTHPESKGLAAELGDRIAALGRAHNYVRPIADEPANRIPFSALMKDLFAPYAADGNSRILVSGDDIEVGEASVTPLALAFHELATNAVKYGALSNDEGHVHLRVEDEGEWLRITWDEQDGPAIDRDVEARGFGSELIETAIVRQLRGEWDQEWRKNGVLVKLRLPKERLK